MWHNDASILSLTGEVLLPTAGSDSRLGNGVFEDAALTPGAAVLVVDIRGREPTASRAVIPAAGTRELDLTVAGRRQ